MEGAYNRTLSEAYQNPLPGRRAWSGSLGWITTVIRFPSGFSTTDLRFRWTLGHDTSEAEEGWHIDNITVSSVSCAATKPIVRMDVLHAEASEFLPLGVARINFSTPLPTGANLPLPLISAGSATPGEDTPSFDNAVIPVGLSSFEMALRPVQDNQAEGTEILELSLDPQFVVPQGISPARITILDTPYGDWAHAHLGPGPASAPSSDFDFDGYSLNVAVQSPHEPYASVAKQLIDQGGLAVIHVTNCPNIAVGFGSFKFLSRH